MKTYDKKLFRSSENKVIFGIIGGIGEYFDIDPVILRVGYILIFVFTAIVPGTIAYILMALVIPRNSKAPHIKEEAREESK